MSTDGSESGEVPPRPPAARLLLLWLAAAAIVLLGSIPGFIGIDHPPRGLNPDESHFVPAAFRAANSSTLDPGYYKNPTVAAYAYVGWLGVDYAAGRVSGQYGDKRDFVLRYFVEPGHFYAWCRLLSAVAGLLAAGLLCVGLGSLFDPTTGVFAGLLVTCGLLVQSKLHAAIDEPLLILVASAAMLTLVAFDRARTTRLFVLASALVGLAVSTKFNAPVLGLPWAFAAWRGLRSKSLSPRAVIAGTVCGMAVLLITTPHLLLSWDAYLDQVLHSRQRLGDDGPYWQNVWLYLRGYGVDFLVPWALLPALAGWALLAAGRQDSAVARPSRAVFLDGGLMALALVLYLAQGRLATSRYALPALPYVVAAVALGLSTLCRAISARSGGSRVAAVAPAVVIGAALFVPAWWSCVTSARGWGELDARWHLTERMRELCGPGDRIVTDWYGPLLPQTELLELHVPDFAQRADVVHIRAHRLFDHLDSGLRPLPGGARPVDPRSLHAAGYRYLVMRERTFEWVGQPRGAAATPGEPDSGGTRAHPELVAFVSRLAELPEPEIVRHTNGAAVYRIYRLD